MMTRMLVVLVATAVEKVKTIKLMTEIVVILIEMMKFVIKRLECWLCLD